MEEYGDAWVWNGFDPKTKIVSAFVIGKRTQKNADRLISKIKEVSDGYIPFFTSDELHHYPNALLKAYGVREKIERKPGKTSRPRKPMLIPPPELNYVQVVKERKKGRVVSVETKIVFGDQGEISQRLASSSVSTSPNIAFVERNHLTLRQGSRRLSRKTNGFSKLKPKLHVQLQVFFSYYHFVKPHGGVGIKKNGKRIPRTPAMAAGITDHIWTMEELLDYYVPYKYINTNWGH